MLSNFSPNSQHRAVSYIRVSSEEQVEGYSLDAQQRAIGHYCEAHGWKVVQEYRDEGKSARSDDLTKRPAFNELLEDAEAGQFDVIVVHKLDRFSRNLKITLDVLDRLERAGVGFVSISENMDFASPIGRVMLANLGAFAQYYSDNLSHETKKGKTERKRQGLYNGLLPFGVTKDDDGVPMPCPDSHPGLVLAFEAAASGASDREVAESLNVAGYRTTGNRGANPFTKDTVRHIVQNRFYVGELPDGVGGWMPGKHDPTIDPALFDEAQRVRALRSPRGRRVRKSATKYSVSGLAVCGGCGSPMHVYNAGRENPRLVCYGRTQGNGCMATSVFLSVIEDTIEEYLDTFHMPDDFAEQIVAMHEASEANKTGVERQRTTAENRLSRLQDLYLMGDISKAEYMAERDDLAAQIASLSDSRDQSNVIARAAAFLRDLPAAWRAATIEQRHQLCHLLFGEVKIGEQQLTSLTVQPDFAPFFWLDFEARQPETLEWRKRRDSNPRSPP